MGNLASVRNALGKLGYAAFTASEPDEILKADKVILPGVGAFEDAIKNLRRRGMDNCVKELVAAQVPLLGICLGMQLLFSESEENGIHEGLDIIPGRVIRFNTQLKVPHMGWNDISINPASRILKGIPDHSYFYFVHSYFVQPEDKSVIAATCNYGIDFTCVVEKDNLFAAQFHPEKSSDMGLRILKNFGEI